MKIQSLFNYSILVTGYWLLFVALVLLTGCYLPHQARLVDGEKGVITHRSLIKRPYEELGLVHAETWGLTIYWKVSAASLRKAVAVALVAEAKKRGADAVIDVDVRVENHYSYIVPILVPLLLGWEECHATGTAIKYTR